MLSFILFLASWVIHCPARGPYFLNWRPPCSLRPTTVNLIGPIGLFPWNQHHEWFELVSGVSRANATGAGLIRWWFEPEHTDLEDWIKPLQSTTWRLNLKPVAVSTWSWLLVGLLQWQTISWSYNRTKRYASICFIGLKEVVTVQTRMICVFKFLGFK